MALLHALLPARSRLMSDDSDEDDSDDDIDLEEGPELQV
jgi:hypothetical protein